ncbi:MAG: hypothetical protein M5U34_03540 [Chloroflexi bacterium]|nr:hypothetical protein [Chloroflexota bacterium]
MNQICTFDYKIAVTYPDGKVIEDQGEFEIIFSETSLRDLDEIDLYGELMFVVLDSFHKEMDERGGLLDNPDVLVSIHNITWDRE